MSIKKLLKEPDKKKKKTPKANPRILASRLREGRGNNTSKRLTN